MSSDLAICVPRTAVKVPRKSWRYSFSLEQMKLATTFYEMFGKAFCRMFFLQLHAAFCNCDCSFWWLSFVGREENSSERS